MTLTAAQCRAGRALLNWSQDELSAASKVGKSTLANFESGKSAPYPRTLDDVRGALERAGVEFIDTGETLAAGGPGVRLRTADVPAS
jgi:transcriptional regulator with XRE-family HTH domain